MQAAVIKLPSSILGNDANILQMSALDFCNSASVTMVLDMFSSHKFG